MCRLLAALIAALLIGAASSAVAAAPARPLLWDGAIGRLLTGGGLCTFFIVRRTEVPGSASYGRMEPYGRPQFLYFVVSNGHCYSDDMQAQLGRDRYRVTGLGFATVIFGVDLMLGIFVSSQDYRVLEIDERLPIIGEYVQVAGFPAGVYRTVVAAVTTIAPHEVTARMAIAIDAALSPGASGSPVLSMDGKVLGVVNLRSTKEQHAFCGLIPCTSVAPSYAIPIRELRAFLQFGD